MAAHLAVSAWFVEISLREGECQQLPFLTEMATSLVPARMSPEAFTHFVTIPLPAPKVSLTPHPTQYL